MIIALFLGSNVTYWGVKISWNTLGKNTLEWASCLCGVTQEMSTFISLLSVHRTEESDGLGVAEEACREAEWNCLRGPEREEADLGIREVSLTPRGSRGALVPPRAFPKGGQEAFRVAAQGLHGAESGLVWLDFSCFCFSVFQKRSPNSHHSLYATPIKPKRFSKTKKTSCLGTRANKKYMTFSCWGTGIFKATNAWYWISHQGSLLSRSNNCPGEETIWEMPPNHYGVPTKTAHQILLPNQEGRG